MTTKPSTAAEKALQKIQDQVTCGVCLEPYKQPRLLKCFHVYCEQCLQRLVRGGREGQSLPCPQCRQDTPLPVGGVPGLQGAFYIHYLFDIQDALKKVSSSEQTMCNKCKKFEAVCFCRTCGFACQRCKEIHQDWDELKTHEYIDLDTLTGDVTTLVPPLKKTLFCATHPSKKAKLYCETCDELVCRDCIVRVHRDHHYDLVPESFAKQEKVIVDCLKPVEEQIATLERAVESVATRCAAVVEQKTAVVAEIRTAMAHLRQALEARETELVGQAEQTAQQKLRTMAAQRDGFELQLGQLRSCQDFVEESRRTCSQEEILRMKSPLMKQVNNLTGSFKPETLALAEQADMKFAHSLPELVKPCQQFGMVYCSQVCPEKCRASGEGIKVATRGQTVAVSVEALDREVEAYLRPVDSLRCELAASDGSSRVSGTVKRRNQNIYDICYQPQVTGEHQLHILIEEHPIFDSPFTVTVLPDFTAPVNVIGDLKGPWGIAVREGGEVVVAERDSGCVSLLSPNGEKKPFALHGPAPANAFYPSGVAIDAEGSILVADFYNNRVQKFSPPGIFQSNTGERGSGDGQFVNPVGIAVDPQNHQVYIADSGNHRIQVFSADRKFCRSFGCMGRGKGQFNNPFGLFIDRRGNVYVTDRDNHRIQVFTDEGLFLRQFGKKGEGEGELKEPVSIAIDSRDMVYISEWGNNRVSVFSTSGQFIKSFGDFKRPLGVGLDKYGTLFVCDTNQNRVIMFS